MPARYAGVFGRSFKIRQSGTGLDLNLRGSATGKASKRDSKARDEGSLKHPVFGRGRFVWKPKRTRKGQFRSRVKVGNPWVTQAIPPGFWTRPARQLADDLRHKLEPIAEKAARRVEAKL